MEFLGAFTSTLTLITMYTLSRPNHMIIILLSNTRDNGIISLIKTHKEEARLHKTFHFGMGGGLKEDTQQNKNKKG